MMIHLLNAILVGHVFRADKICNSNGVRYETTQGSSVGSRVGNNA
jgi:hypothetical protein